MIYLMILICKAMLKGKHIKEGNRKRKSGIIEEGIITDRQNIIIIKISLIIMIQGTEEIIRQ